MIPFHCTDTQRGAIMYNEKKWELYQKFHEWRHSPCLMFPYTSLLLAALSFFSLLALVCRLPSTIIAFLITTPIMNRGNWAVEFLYPLPIARWGHIWLSRFSIKSGGDYKYHSEALKQRVEVIKRRVYIHSIPVLIDNLAYLIVACPDKNEPSTVPLVGVLVDCGDADPVIEAIQAISELHYDNRKIQIVAILSTHKHHDHTAGNKKILNYQLKHGCHVQVFGGAIEKVPMCTHFLKDGEILHIPPLKTNDMNSFVRIEAISVPSHTRGSLVFRMSTKKQTRYAPVHYLFTGDAMFSAGGGLPFEADLDYGKETPSHIEKRKSHDRVRPTVGNYSVERCFAEILLRCSPSNTSSRSIYSCENYEYDPKVIIFPGHEYTAELLQRQLSPAKGNTNEWHKLPPSNFFQVTSHYFSSLHRRTLPKGSRILTVPTCLSNELIINPYFRNLRRYGHLFITALNIWYNYLSIQKFSDGYLEKKRDQKNNKSCYKNIISKSPSTFYSWNLSYNDISRPVFTTVYTNDLQQIISDLRSNTISTSTAADRLSNLSSRLDDLQCTRRPIPNTLPKEKTIWLGTLALTLLGSPPSGLTQSDAKRMNLPIPISNSDLIKISKLRLLVVLIRLGVIDGFDCKEAKLIGLLWKEACWDDISAQNTESGDEENNCNGNANKGLPNNYEAVVDVASLEFVPDEIELGYLKKELYGVNYNVPNNTKSPFCLPCGLFNKKNTSNTAPITTKPDAKNKATMIRLQNLQDMKRADGELLRHDLEKCLICGSIVGCPHTTEIPEIDRAAPEQIEILCSPESKSSFLDTESLVLGAASVASSTLDDHISIGGEMEVIFGKELSLLSN